MGDHLNLLTTYSKIKNESIAYLINKYNASIVEEASEFSNSSTVLQLLISVVDYKIKILISLPFNFPDSFPKVSLEEESYNRLYPLPHLSKSKTLCIFDEVLASPNPENPLGILDATVAKTKETLEKGILKENLEDYIDEFETYWIEESNSKFISIVQPSNIAEEIYLVPFQYSNWSYSGLLANDKIEALNWIQNLGGIAQEKNIIKVLYIPLSTSIKFPFIENNKDIYNLIKHDKKLLHALSKYLTKQKRPTKVLFSMKMNDEYSWGMWEHLEPFKKEVLLYKGYKRTHTQIKGFRKGKTQGYLEIIRDFPKMKIDKHSVEDIRAERLIKRGGDGVHRNKDLKMAFIGCGAIGGNLIQGLADTDVNHMLFVDYDILSFENINRHICGANYVNRFKTDSIKDKLTEHNPAMCIHTYKGDILSLLKQTPNTLNNYDLTVVAVAHLPTELRLSQLQQEGVIQKPLLFVWVEPYLAGGHAIWVHPEDKINLKSLFDSNGSYKYQILKNGNEYAKKEFGCNTSYIPYGTFELKKFTLDMITFVQGQLQLTEHRSQAFTWFGDVAEQRKNKRLLAAKWVGVQNYTSRIIPLH